MKLRNGYFRLGGALVLLLLPFQSLLFSKHDHKLLKKHDHKLFHKHEHKHGLFHSKNSDCATNAVAPGGGGGCCLPEGAEFGYFDGAEGGYMILEPNAIYLTVNVPEITLDSPADALLFINGDPTASTGVSRRFIVRNLEPEKVYNFEVVAITKNRAGVQLIQKKTVKLQVGDTHTMAMKPVKRNPFPLKPAPDPNAPEAVPPSPEDPYFEDVDAEPVALAFPFSLE